jgi:hypothetical protein
MIPHSEDTRVRMGHVRSPSLSLYSDVLSDHSGLDSALYCLGDYTFTTFGNIADCCSVGGGLCHPATDCSTDYEGTTRVVKYQGGDFANWYFWTLDVQDRS